VKKLSKALHIYKGDKLPTKKKIWEEKAGHPTVKEINTQR